MERTGLTQIVCQRTRGTNTLDKIFVSSPQLFDRVRVVASAVKSDHKAVVAFPDSTSQIQRCIANTFTGGTRQHSTQSSFSTPPTSTSQIRAPRPVQTRRLTHRQSSTIFNAMLCIRGTSHERPSVCPSVCPCPSVCHKSEFY